jgi:hypothetical protein
MMIPEANKEPLSSNDLALLLSFLNFRRKWNILNLTRKTSQRLASIHSDQLRSIRISEITCPICTQRSR